VREDRPVAPARVLDLNADLGESYGAWVLGDDEALMPFLSSANVACGFHAGDPLTLRRTVASAARHGVVVGAQVSYPDVRGFGRREMTVPPDELEADVLYQLAALDGLSRAAGTRVRYLKPHGALYHRTLTDPVQAGAVVAAVVAYDATLPVVTMAAGQLAAAAAAAGLRVIREAFADRAYGPDGRLVPRGESGALLDDPTAAAEQAVALVASASVDSLCVHGDTPAAVAMAQHVRARLEAAGVTIRSFA
jgi:UPF0271 protein